MKDLSKKTSIRIAVLLWAIFGTGLILVLLLFFSISKGLVGYMPSVEELESPIDKFATQIISSDGELLGTFSYTRDNRVWVGFNELSPFLVQALISTEDIRFLDHSGIDLKALSRAVVKRLILSKYT